MDQKKTKKEKSIIDYIIVSNNMLNRIEEMIVDEKGTYRIKERNDIDHNTILTTIKVKNMNEGKTMKRWKLDNKAGWIQLNQKIWKNQNPNSKIPRTTKDNHKNNERNYRRSNHQHKKKHKEKTVKKLKNTEKRKRKHTKNTKKP